MKGIRVTDAQGFEYIINIQNISLIEEGPCVVYMNSTLNDNGGRIQLSQKSMRELVNIIEKEGFIYEN